MPAAWSRCAWVTKTLETPVAASAPRPRSSITPRSRMRNHVSWPARERPSIVKWSVVRVKRSLSIARTDPDVIIRRDADLDARRARVAARGVAGPVAAVAGRDAVPVADVAASVVAGVRLRRAVDDRCTRRKRQSERAPTSLYRPRRGRLSPYVPRYRQQRLFGLRRQRRRRAAPRRARRLRLRAVGPAGAAAGVAAAHRAAPRGDARPDPRCRSLPAPP